MYGWKYGGKTKSGKHTAFFWNDGNITDTKVFGTLQACMDFIWYGKIKALAQ